MKGRPSLCNRTLRWLTIALVLGGWLTLRAEDYQLSWFTIGNGGGLSTNDFFGVHGSIGQPQTGTITNQEYQIEGGFWAATLRTKPFLRIVPLVDITNASIGSSFTFTATPVGLPPFQIQWQLNGVNLPGETNETLTIMDAQLAQGGFYSWSVANEYGVTNSSSASVQFNLDILPPPPSSGDPPQNDNFADRRNIPLSTPSFRGSNFGATNETNEPHHGGKLGGSSVWYSWGTNANGIATFRTRGSGFDTLLAVYAAGTLETLQENAVASDDDSDSFLASEVRFNVTAGTEYQIAIDGLGGREGGFTLSWEFEPTPQTPQVLPVIEFGLPRNRATLPRGTTRFFVHDGVNGPGLTYQWHFNGNAIADATNAALLVTNILEKDLGFYHVGVTNIKNAVIYGVQSRLAALEFGPKESAFSYAKLEDLILAAELANAGEGGGALLAAAIGAAVDPFISVSVGEINSQTFKNTDGTIAKGNCGSCQVLGGAVKYLGLEMLDSGVLVLTTYGSTYNRTGQLDTVLTVYDYKAHSELASKPCDYLIGCDDNKGPDGVSSRLSFPVLKGNQYAVEIDEVHGSTNGTVKLSWELYRTPSPFEYSDNGVYLLADTNLVLYRNEYCWYRNGNALPPTTEPRLRLDTASGSTATYSLVVDVQSLETTWSVRRLTNSFGSILSAIGRPTTTNFQLLLPFTGPSVLTTNFQVETLTAPLTYTAGGWAWLPVTPLSRSTNGGTNLILNFPMNSAGGFYRVRPLPLDSRGSTNF